MALTIPLGVSRHSRRRRTGHGLDRETLDDDPAEAVQINEVRELDAVAECAAGSNNGVFEGNGTDGDSEVNPRGPFGDACRLGRTH